MPGKPTHKRKRLSERETIDVLISQGVIIRCPCPYCARATRYGIPLGARIITKGAESIREHLHQLGVDGADAPDNWQYWHVACSDRKTHGTKATSAGSDAHARAKIRRQTGQNKPKVKRKIQSRPFAKRKKP